MLMTLPGVSVRPAGEDLEEDDQRHQGEDHAELAGVAAKDLLERVHCFSPCVRGDRSVLVWSQSGQAVLRADVMSLHEAFLARLRPCSSTPVMAPSKIV